MSEEKLDLATQEQEVVAEEKIVTEEEIPKGYISKDKWIDMGRDPEDWVSKKEYERAGSLMKQLDTVKKEMSAVVKLNQQIVKKFNDAELRGYEKGIKDLKAARKEAIEVGDSDQVDKITEVIDQYQNTAKELKQEAETPTVRGEVLDFAKRNQTWFQKDARMTQFACAKEAELLALHPELGNDLSELYERVQDEVESTFTDFFGKKAKPKAPPLASSQRVSSDKETFTIHDLSKIEKEMYLGTYKSLSKESQKEYTPSYFINELKNLGLR
jgi:hypothetical protein